MLDGVNGELVRYKGQVGSSLTNKFRPMKKLMHSVNGAWKNKPKSNNSMYINSRRFKMKTLIILPNDVQENKFSQATGKQGAEKPFTIVQLFGVVSVRSILDRKICSQDSHYHNKTSCKLEIMSFEENED